MRSRPWAARSLGVPYVGAYSSRVAGVAAGALAPVMACNAALGLLTPALAALGGRLMP